MADATTTAGGVPAPAFQPAGVERTGAASTQPHFGHAAILWWKNGIWGDAGYALPNCGDKDASGNESIRSITLFLGRELFTLMHMPDVRFSRPFNVEWLYEAHKMLTLGIKRMSDGAVGWTDERTGDAAKAVNTRQSFVVYPVPFFGGRVRQQDALRWCGWMLNLIGECMQHTDNDFDDDFTDHFAAMVQTALMRTIRDMAMKYFGYTREEVSKPDFAGIAAEKFKAYNPEHLFTSAELVEETMPVQWWPTANDLTPIRGIPMTVARMWGVDWPEGVDLASGGAVEAAWPGGGWNLIRRPGSMG